SSFCRGGTAFGRPRNNPILSGFAPLRVECLSGVVLNLCLPNQPRYLAHDFSLAVDIERGRKVLDITVGFGDFVGTQQDRIIYSHLAGELGDFIRVAIVHGYAENGQPVVTVMVL